MDKRVTSGKDPPCSHSEELKQELVERSLEPCSSVAAIALEHGIDANPQLCSPMQPVITLIEDLRKAGVEVPVYPLVEPMAAVAGTQPAQTAAGLQARVGAFEARVEAWRQDVIELHAKHFRVASRS